LVVTRKLLWKQSLVMYTEIIEPKLGNGFPDFRPEGLK